MPLDFNRAYRDYGVCKAYQSGPDPSGREYARWINSRFVNVSNIEHSETWGIFPYFLAWRTPACLGLMIGGTETYTQWWQNFVSGVTDFTTVNGVRYNPFFWSTADRAFNFLGKVMQAGDYGKPLFLYGHSLGGAAAEALALFLTTTNWGGRITVDSWGAPYFTDAAGRDVWATKNIDSIRYVGYGDPVPQVPKNFANMAAADVLGVSDNLESYRHVIPLTALCEEGLYAGDPWDGGLNEQMVNQGPLIYTVRHAMSHPNGVYLQALQKVMQNEAAALTRAARAAPPVPMIQYLGFAERESPILEEKEPEFPEQAVIVTSVDSSEPPSTDMITTAINRQGDMMLPATDSSKNMKVKRVAKDRYDVVWMGSNTVAYFSERARAYSYVRRANHFLRTFTTPSKFDDVAFANAFTAYIAAAQTGSFSPPLVLA